MWVRRVWGEQDQGRPHHQNPHTEKTHQHSQMWFYICGSRLARFSCHYLHRHNRDNIQQAWHHKQIRYRVTSRYKYSRQHSSKEISRVPIWTWHLVFLFLYNWQPAFKQQKLRNINFLFEQFEVGGVFSFQSIRAKRVISHVLAHYYSNYLWHGCKWDLKGRQSNFWSVDEGRSRIHPFVALCLVLLRPKNLQPWAFIDTGIIS